MIGVITDIDTEELKWKLIDKDTVRFYRKDKEEWAWVEVSNLSPVKITNTVFHDPKILNKKTTDAYSSVASNDSDVVEMTRSYSITEGRSESQTTNVGASVTVGIHQSIGYGSEIAQVQGETSFGIDVTASFDAGWEYSVEQNAQLLLISLSHLKHVRHLQQQKKLVS